MSIPKNIVRETPGLSEWNIMTCYRGSIAHGMYTENGIDDKDIMAVCVPPLDYYFGLKQYHSKGTHEIMRNEWDIVIYEARKMLGLLAKGNPNVLMTLWLESNHYITTSKAWQMVVDNRYLFVGKHVYHSFTGYAHSQLTRMTHHAFEGYMGQKRKALVEKFGYDTKNAAHLIRLLNMGIEFLTEGRLYVLRPDAQMLLSIKRGEWTLEHVQAEAQKLFDKARDIYTTCTLPNGVDYDKINALTTQVVQTALEEQLGKQQN